MRIQKYSQSHSHIHHLMIDQLAIDFMIASLRIRLNQAINQFSLLGPKLEQLFLQLVGREVMDVADMEDLDRQKRSDLMRDTIMDKLAETGEKDKLKDMLRDRLILSGEK